MNTNILTNLIITKFYSATSMYTEANSKTLRTNRDRWAIVLKYEGETVYFSEDKEYISNINSIIILPKGCSYEWICTVSGHFAIIEFDCDASYGEIFQYKIRQTDKFLNLFRHMEYRSALKKASSSVENIRDIYSLIVLILQSSKSGYFSTLDEKKITPALQYITKNYNKDISCEYLASICGISQVYLRKLFKKICGSSPLTYIHTLRIEKAKEMLKSDYGSITDIATTLGYPNIYDFSRTFKKFCGVSPSKY